MKITTNEIKEIPKAVGSGFCVYGQPTEKVASWVEYHNFETVQSGAFTNIIIPSNYDLSKCFETKEKFKYVDGFSPNLNKYLHLGHVSNFVLAKAFQKMEVGEKYVANLGDTLTGDVNKEDALKAYLQYCNMFDYKVDQIFYASELTGADSLLIDGEGEYIGTKIFDIDGKKIVGKKSSGATTYFYQDVCLAKLLNDKTLYMTGMEQTGHFADLKTMFPQIEHLGLGLVTVKGEKMSSRKGNVIYFSEIIDIFKEKFGDNDKLIWNVLAGYILKSVPSSNKNIDLDQLDNVKLSFGLYLSYTLAKLKSAGLLINENEKFNSQSLCFKYLKAKNNLQPNILFEGVVELAKEISGLYEKLIIKDNTENQKVFKPLAEDLLLGMKKLGLFNIDKV